MRAVATTFARPHDCAPLACARCVTAKIASSHANLLAVRLQQLDDARTGSTLTHHDGADGRAVRLHHECDKCVGLRLTPLSYFGAFIRDTYTSSATGPLTSCSCTVRRDRDGVASLSLPLGGRPQILACIELGIERFVTLYARRGGRRRLAR